MNRCTKAWCASVASRQRSVWCWWWVPVMPMGSFNACSSTDCEAQTKGESAESAGLKKDAIPKFEGFWCRFFEGSPWWYGGFNGSLFFWLLNWPVSPKKSWGALIGGVGAGVLWTCQGAFFTTCCQRVATAEGRCTSQITAELAGGEKGGWFFEMNWKAKYGFLERNRTEL